MKYCMNCGNQLDDKIKFCPVCGSKQPNTVDDGGSIEEGHTKVELYNRKKRVILISSIIGVVALIILAVVIGAFILRKNKRFDSETTTIEATTTEATTEKVTTEKATTEEPTTEDLIELENIVAKEAYYDMISDIAIDAVSYSGDSIACIDESDSSVYLIYDNYAIEDFDSDGIVELIVYTEWNESPDGESVSYGENIDFYEYDAEKASATLIHSTSGELGNFDCDTTIFYDNGVIEFTDDGEASAKDGTFVCVNTGMFDIMGCDDYDDIYETEIDGEIWSYMISIFKDNDGTYYLYFTTNFSVDYMYELSKKKTKEYLNNLHDANQINDVEINDFNLKNLSDVCGFDYDESVAEIEANTPAVDYDAMYGEVIEKYIQFVNEGADYSQVRDEEFPYEADDGCYDEYNIGIVDPLGEVGYLISDLDGNGIPELIIGLCDDSFVLDVYTIRNDEIVLILNSGERTQLYYCGGATFLWSGSSGATSSDVGLYQIESGYATILEVLYTEPKDDDFSESLFYYSTISVYDPENATEISSDEYTEKWEEFRNKTCNVAGLTPLSEY